MNDVKNLLVAGSLALGLLAHSGAGAVVITIEESNGQSVGNYSGGDKIHFDVKFTTGKPVVVDVLVEESDGDVLTLHGSYGNVTGSAWSGFNVDLSGGATWQNMSSIIPVKDAATISLSADSSSVETLFDLELESPSIIELGSSSDSVNGTALANAKDDWVINIKDVIAGNQFQITLQPEAVSVPEPGIIALLALGLAGAGFARRGRRGVDLQA